MIISGSLVISISEKFHENKTAVICLLKYTLKIIMKVIPVKL